MIINRQLIAPEQATEAPQAPERTGHFRPRITSRNRRSIDQFVNVAQRALQEGLFASDADSDRPQLRHGN